MIQIYIEEFSQIVDMYLKRYINLSKERYANNSNGVVHNFTPFGIYCSNCFYRLLNEFIMLVVATIEPSTIDWTDYDSIETTILQHWHKNNVILRTNFTGSKIK